jgi:hypothetical protein
VPDVDVVTNLTSQPSFIVSINLVRGVITGLSPLKSDKNVPYDLRGKPESVRSVCFPLHRRQSYE